MNISSAVRDFELTRESRMDMFSSQNSTKLVLSITLICGMIVP
jgi:hypothetical protein